MHGVGIFEGSIGIGKGICVLHAHGKDVSRQRIIGQSWDLGSWTFVGDSVEGLAKMYLGSGHVDIAMLCGVGQRENCGELRMDAPVVVPPRVVGLLGENQPPPQRSGPPTVKQQQQQQQNRWAGLNKQNKQPGPPGAGVGSFNAGRVDDGGGNSDLILQLLQSILSPEDFSKYEKVLSPPKAEKTKRREEALLEKVQTQERLEKQEMGHVEQISKHEYNLEQERKMLQEVRSTLATVRDEVVALRALVADPTEPSGHEIQPPLPPPLHPPPVIEEVVEPEETQLVVEVQPAEMPIDDDEMESGSERHIPQKDDKKRCASEEKKSMVIKKGKRVLLNPSTSS